jgi:hypothetical protein
LALFSAIRRDALGFNEERAMAKDHEAMPQSKQAPVRRTGVRVGGGIITASMPSHRPSTPKPATKRGVRVGGGIITANMPQ